MQMSAFNPVKSANGLIRSAPTAFVAPRIPGPSRTSAVRSVPPATANRRTFNPHVVSMRAAKGDDSIDASNFGVSDLDSTNTDLTWIDESLLPPAPEGFPPPAKTDSKSQSTSEATSAPSQTTTSKQPPPHDPAIMARTEKILNILDNSQRFGFGLTDTLFDKTIDLINANSRSASLAGGLARDLVNTLKDRSDPEGRKEFLYLVLKSADIIDRAALNERPAEGDKPRTSGNSFALSVAKDQVNRILSHPQQHDPLGILGAYHKALDFALGDNLDKLYDILGVTKDFMLDTIIKDDPASLAAKLKVFIGLAISVDTGRAIPVPDLVKSIQSLGVPAIKLAQTASLLTKEGLLSLIQSSEAQMGGGDAKDNPLVKLLENNPAIDNFFEACSVLQDANEPMTPEEVRTQLADQYQALGDGWESKLFRSTDFENPIGTGSIAGSYLAENHVGEEVNIKVQKPDLKQQIKRDRAQTEQLLGAMYDIIDESVYYQQRLGRKIPGLESQIEIIRNAEQSTNDFFGYIERETDFISEANKMRATRCNAPTVISAGPNAIITKHIKGGVKPSDFLEMSRRTKPVDYKKADSAASAAKGWLQSHYPYTLNGEPESVIAEKGQSYLKASFAENGVSDMTLKVKKVGGEWSVKPTQPYVDFSEKSRLIFATEFLADIIKQIDDNLLNCDPHPGNFVAAPGNGPGKNEFWHFDWGLTDQGPTGADVTSSLLIGLITSDYARVSRGYLLLTDKGQSLSDAELNKSAQDLVDYLKESNYFEKMMEKPAEASGPIIKHLSDKGFNLGGQGIAVMRAMGILSNIVNLQDGSMPKAYQATYLVGDLTKALGPRKLLEFKEAIAQMMKQIQAHGV